MVAKGKNNWLNLSKRQIGILGVELLLLRPLFLSNCQLSHYIPFFYRKSIIVCFGIAKTIEQKGVFILLWPGCCWNGIIHIYVQRVVNMLHSSSKHDSYSVTECTIIQRPNAWILFWNMQKENRHTACSRYHTPVCVCAFLNVQQLGLTMDCPCILTKDQG